MTSSAASAGPTLWLLRHGKAADPLGVPDAGRPLTERGERQAAEQGATLARLAPDLAAVLTSPRVRARTTAELAVAAHGSAPEPQIWDVLGGDYALADLLALTGAWLDEPLAGGAAAPAVLVVGHNPTLAVLAHELTGDVRGLSTGTLVAIDLTSRRVVHHIKPEA
jgi:phosphohistidine phosphatase